jgi:hypothetical protein
MHADQSRSHACSPQMLHPPNASPCMPLPPSLPFHCCLQIQPPESSAERAPGSPPLAETLSTPCYCFLCAACCIAGAAVLTVAGVATLCLGLRVHESAGARVDLGGLPNHEAVLDQLPDVLPCGAGKGGARRCSGCCPFAALRAPSLGSILQAPVTLHRPFVVAVLPCEGPTAAARCFAALRRRAGPAAATHWSWPWRFR